MQDLLEDVRKSTHALPPAHASVCTPADDEEVDKLLDKIKQLRQDLVSKKVPHPKLNKLFAKLFAKSKLTTTNYYSIN
jgi:hypothetical protein